MKLSIISGSQRTDSETARVGAYVEKRAQEQLKASTFHLDLGSNPLPFWTPEFESQSLSSGMSVLDLKAELDSSDAFVLLTPEWHGMATAAIKNFLLCFSAGETLSHKPALLVCVSAGRGGAYPISELRMSGYKNSRICFIPDHVIVRDVGNVLQGEASANDGDTFVREKIDYSVQLLGAYTGALRAVRNESELDFSRHTNGM